MQPNFERDTHPTALDVPQVTAKGKFMGVSNATARNLFVCLSFFSFLASLTVPLRPALAQSLRPVLAQSQKPTASYDEKKRQANDIAVAVVVSGI